VADPLPARKSIRCRIGVHDWYDVTRGNGTPYYRCNRCGKVDDSLPADPQRFPPFPSR
jgi:hypothetical protein